jgi:hypothetical protein
MPTCPECQLAYLEGESHRCAEAIGEPLSVASITLGHAAGGAIAGAILFTILCITLDGTGGPTCFLFGGVIGAPVGVAIGALVGARRARRK